MSPRRQHYESFIASAYAAPIFVLVEDLQAGRGRVNEVQASPFEHGRSASIIALTVLFLESFLNVSKHVMGSQERNIRKYFRATFLTSSYQVDVVELFAIRDVIAHSHVWEGEIDPVAMKWVTLQLLSGYGDTAFQRVVDMTNRVTKKLGLNVIPTRLCFDDVRTTIKTTVAILRELQAWHESRPVPHYIGPGGFGPVQYRGDYLSFLDAADLL